MQRFSPSILCSHSIELLGDGTQALVGVLAMVTGAGGVDIDGMLQ
jgi:hypothetical protein